MNWPVPVPYRNRRRTSKENSSFGSTWNQMALHGINAAVVPSGIFYNADEVHPRGMWNIMTNGTPPHYQSRNFFQNFFSLTNLPRSQFFMRRSAGFSFRDESEINYCCVDRRYISSAIGITGNTFSSLLLHYSALTELISKRSVHFLLPQVLTSAQNLHLMILSYSHLHANRIKSTPSCQTIIPPFIQIFFFYV